jgi:hypothetical protein
MCTDQHDRSPYGVVVLVGSTGMLGGGSGSVEVDVGAGGGGVEGVSGGVVAGTVGVVATGGEVVTARVVTGRVVTGCVVAGCVVADGVAAGGVVAGGVVTGGVVGAGVAGRVVVVGSGAVVVVAGVGSTVVSSPKDTSELKELGGVRGVTVDGGEAVPDGSTEGTLVRSVSRRRARYASRPASLRRPVESENQSFPADTECQSAMSIPERSVDRRRIRSFADWIHLSSPAIVTNTMVSAGVAIPRTSPICSGDGPPLAVRCNTTTSGENAANDVRRASGTSDQTMDDEPR